MFVGDIVFSINIEYKSNIECIDRFPDEQACINQLEGLHWDKNVIDPFDSDSQVYKCKDNKFLIKKQENSLMFERILFLKIRRLNYRNGF